MNVQLLDWMGTDLDVVNAARVSMAKESEWEQFIEGYELQPSFAPGDDDWRPNYGKCLSERDKRLIQFLARNEHWTPFAQTSVKFRIRMPIFLARQWFKHQVGVVRNEVSRRYVDDEPEFVQLRWRNRPEKSVKQGSGEVVGIEKQGYFNKKANEAYEKCREAYHFLLDGGAAPEQARAVLPQGMITEFIETGNVATYARIERLRNDPHAQVEVQEYAQAISEELAVLFPVSWEALTNG